MTNHTDRTIAADRVAGAEGRLAYRMAGELTLAAGRLPHDISERLRFGREQALARARRALADRPAAAAVVLAQGGGTAALGASPGLWLRLVSLMPLVVLVAGLVLIQHHHEHEQIVAAAEVDAALLADELPPAAYRDPGFVAYLMSQDER